MKNEDIFFLINLTYQWSTNTFKDKELLDVYEKINMSLSASI